MSTHIIVENLLKALKIKSYSSFSNHPIPTNPTPSSKKKNINFL